MRIHARCRVWQPALPRLQIRNHGDVADDEPVPESFVIPKEEQPVLLDRPPDTAAELISSERRSGALHARSRAEIEDGPRIERAVAQKFENRSVKLIRAGLRNATTCAPARFPYSAE